MMHLWRSGPSTAHELFELVSEERSRGYTTILTFLGRMEEKGYVKVDRSQRAHTYSAAIPFARAMAEESTYILRHHLQGDPEAIEILGGAVGKHLAVGQPKSTGRHRGAPKKRKDSAK